MVKIMESDGRGLTLFEPVNTIKELPFSTADDRFNKEFLETWKRAYELEDECGGNAGINILSVLEAMLELHQKGKLTINKNFDSAYEQAVDYMLNSEA